MELIAYISTGLLAGATLIARCLASKYRYLNAGLIAGMHDPIGLPV